MSLQDRIRSSVADIRAHGQRLVQLNVELFKAEARQKAQQYGAAAGLFIAAALLALYALGFVLATIAAALAIVLPVWLALLIVTVVLLVIVAILVAVGRSRLRAAKSPAPQAAAVEAKATVSAFRSGVDRVATRLRSGTAPSAGSPADAGSPSPPSGSVPSAESAPGDAPSAGPGGAAGERTEEGR